MSGKCVFLYLAGGVLAVGNYKVAALIHEGGHALFGWLFGGVCLWIRLGTILWVPGGGFVRGGRRKLNSAGECVLLCPDKKSLRWAAYGGGFANLFSALIAGVFFIWLGKGGRIFCPFGLGVTLFIICSLLMAFLSLFFRWGGEKNDGVLAKKCREDEFCRRMQRDQQRDLLRLEYGLLEEMF